MTITAISAATTASTTVGANGAPEAEQQPASSSSSGSSLWTLLGGAAGLGVFALAWSLAGPKKPDGAVSAARIAAEQLRDLGARPARAIALRSAGSEVGGLSHAALEQELTTLLIKPSTELSTAEFRRVAAMSQLPAELRPAQFADNLRPMLMQSKSMLPPTLATSYVRGGSSPTKTLDMLRWFESLRRRQFATEEGAAAVVERLRTGAQVDAIAFQTAERAHPELFDQAGYSPERLLTVAMSNLEDQTLLHLRRRYGGHNLTVQRSWLYASENAAHASDLLARITPRDDAERTIIDQARSSLAGVSTLSSGMGFAAPDSARVGAAMANVELLQRVRGVPTLSDRAASVAAGGETLAW